MGRRKQDRTRGGYAGRKRRLVIVKRGYKAKRKVSMKGGVEG